ncbi:MAG: hypothetical protein FWJ59_03745 [Caldicoprobacter sp.]|uniref:hypothetical protein n=1 Tax=Caldicoprobacter sp. TaxID=2004500 RepID=UPI0039C2164C
MDLVCPLCNGLIIAYEVCDRCGGPMVEQGKMEDYKGPYSPYVDRETFAYDMNNGIVMGDHLCVHLYYCERCNRWKHKAVYPRFF